MYGKGDPDHSLIPRQGVVNIKTAKKLSMAISLLGFFFVLMQHITELYSSASQTFSHPGNYLN